MCDVSYYSSSLVIVEQIYIEMSIKHRKNSKLFRCDEL